MISHKFQLFELKETNEYQVIVENLHGDPIEFNIEFAPCYPKYQWVDDM